MKLSKTKNDKTIRSSEYYAQSKERMELLNNMIVEGEEAKLVIKYAEKFLDVVERETLDSLARQNGNHEEAANFYRAAVRFVDMLRAAVSLGEKKAEALDKLKKASVQ